MAANKFTTSPLMLSVSDLNRQVKQLLESSFPLFWISGEISNFTRAASGHWYFSLKDDRAQVRCVMFKGRNSLVDFMPREGDHIEARAVVGLYEARGDFQLTVEYLQQAGLGRLYEAFEALKQRLLAEGLFDTAHKKAIPTHPQRIGIVTSPDAAALHDVCTAIRRRHAGVQLIVYPTAVQGKDAAAQIAHAIETASQRNEVDVLLICRGGGSMEDLWSFNEEQVARAIHACRLPTISGVGHETDTTITDFVADLRAATPTAAAELACPDRRREMQFCQQRQQQLQRAMQQQLQRKSQALDYLSRRLVSPQQQLQLHRQRCQQWQQRLQFAMQHQLQRHQRRWSHAASSLQQLNPSSVLARGYAIVRKQNGKTVHHSAELAMNEQIELTLHQGQAMASITTITPPRDEFA